MRRKSVLATALLAMLQVAAFIAWPRRADLRAFDPAGMARLETAMWRDYCEKRYPALFYHLYQLSRTQFGFSPSDSFRIALSAAKAARAFQPIRSRGEAAAALPELVVYYALLRPAAPAAFDVETVACLELDWWQARREAIAPSAYGLTIADVAALTYGKSPDDPAITASGIARAETMAYRDAPGSDDGARLGRDRSAVASRLSAPEGGHRHHLMAEAMKKAPAEAGAFRTFKSGRDQYFATTGPPQLKR